MQKRVSKAPEKRTFATKNSISLGRFRVKNATVRAGKSLCYGLRPETRLFGVGNAIVWGYFCDCWRFVISCLSTFATKNSISLGRFRVKNATVRAGKSLCYGLRL